MKKNILFNCMLISLALSVFGGFATLDVKYPTEESMRISKEFEEILKEKETLMAPEQSEQLRQYAFENPEQMLGVHSSVTYFGFWLQYSTEILIWLPFLLVGTITASYLNYRKLFHA